MSNVETLTTDTTLTYQGWFSGKYQAHKELYLRDTFGLRNIFIRTHNQIDFSLFRKPNASEIIIGENDNFFLDWYLKAHCGNDFIGSKSIAEKLEELKKIQDKLREMNKTFLLVFAPAKDFVDSSFLPEGYSKPDSNNYDVYARIIKSTGLNYIDFNKYFMEIRHSTKYPLYSKYASHWSPYGACVAGDSIITMLEKLRGIKMVHTEWENNIVSEPASGDEIELENELNLLFPLDHPIMGHPKIKTPVDSGIKKPSVLVIGDSYYWGLGVHYNFGASFSSSKFCYYFKTVYTSGVPNPTDVDSISLFSEIEKADIIIVEGTVPSLRIFSWNFADDAYKALFVDSAKNAYNEKLIAMRNEMKQKPDLMETIAKKAKENNIATDSMLTLDAIWLINQSKKQPQ